MTLVFDKGAQGPGTHALIVASGDLPRYPKAATGAAFGAARAIADWLIYTFRHPGAELATVDFLAAAPGTPGIDYVPPGRTAAFRLDPPQFDSFAAAVEGWRRRLDSDAGNIAFFYYAGYVFRRPETLLPLQDFAAGGGVISFPIFLDAMRGCGAARQLHIVDGIPLPVGAAVKALKPRPLAGPPPRKPAGWGVIHGESRVGRTGKATEFSRGLLGVLDRPRGQNWISVRDVIAGLGENLTRAAAKVLSAEVHPDFDLHYPGLGGPKRPPAPSPAPAPAPPVAASAGGLGGVFEEDDHDGRADAADPAAPGEVADEAGTEFVADDAEAERDALGRSGLAIVLARRLHKIWRVANAGASPGGAEARAAFVVHIDAPWGGGKTSFANFLGAVLNPCPGGGGKAAWFLRQRHPGRDLGGIFLDDPPPDPAAAAALAALPDDARRPWIVVPFNAWQAEHCTPPWWVFYQAIRKGCFDALWREGDGAWTPRPPGAARRWPAWLRRGRRALGGRMRWLYLALREYLWRLGNPNVRSVLVAAALGALLLLGLRWMGVEFDLASGLGFLSGGLAAFWGLAAFFTESIAPGSGTVAERLSLGAGDPFARFRVHFARMMERVRRPVMVVVDDLDRCRPDFVVDLVRGIQTLLRSPRVVFVILGDRDWIERAFEAHHQAMKDVDVGPEQSFGARFVEKAIQMSFILPRLGRDGRLGYVRRVLLGDRAVEEEDAAEVARMREAAARAAARPDADPFAAAPIVEQVVEQERRRGRAAGLASPGYRLARIEHMVSEMLSVRAATDEAVEREAVHELQRLAGCFPANPRQIKRIVNAVTIYYAVALQRPGLVPDKAFRAQLALWVIVMTEWPRTWRLLAAFPDLVDILTAAKAGEAMAKKGVSLPGSVAATRAALAPIRADAELMALITGKGEGAAHAPLETRHVRILAELTPLHSRLRRLPEAAAESPPRAAGGARPRPAGK